MNRPWLGTVLDGDAVFLDPTHARLIHLDRETLDVWEHCEGYTAATLAQVLGLPLRRVNRALKVLARATAVAAQGERWFRSPVRWV